MLRILLALVLVSCTGEPTPEPIDDPLAEAPLVGPADGAYVVAFHRDGGAFAVGRFTVAENRVTGQAWGPGGIEVHGDGHVTADGTLVVDRLWDEANRDIVFESGQVRDGVLEGTYTLGDETGHFAGTRRDRLLREAPTDAFDGSYEIGLVRDDEEVSASVLIVRRGRFRTRFTSPDGITVEVQGFVTTDGTLVLAGDDDVDGLPVMAEAAIDQDRFTVEGVYRLGERVGRVVGRRSD